MSKYVCLFIYEKGKIPNKEYQEMYVVPAPTASRDLSELVEKQLIQSSGIKGAGAFYILKK